MLFSSWAVLASILLSPLLLHADLLVPRGAVWKYDDSGTDLASAWRAAGFDDSSWDSGPAQLGYGDGDEATVISFGPSSSNKIPTYYFRRSFAVLDPGAVGDLTLRLVRDDGAIVYLNGVEVLRANMPAGPVTFNTFAVAAIGGADENTFLESSIAPGLLVPGANLLAVEIHQVNATSSDLGFDLELEGTPPPPPLPTVTLETPADGSAVNSTLVTFTSSATDALGLADATLYVGGAPVTVALSGPAATQDTYLSADQPGSNFGSDSFLNVDSQAPHAHALIKFPGLIGSGPGQVPPGSTISSATLEVSCFDPGSLMQVYRLTEDWIEGEATWSQRAAGIPWGSPGADGPGSNAGVPFAADCTVTGLRQIDVRQLVEEWASGAPNFGVVFVDTGTNGVDWTSSEGGTPPVLRVTYWASDWQAIETKPLSGASDAASFTVLLADGGSYVWNCFVRNTSAQGRFAAADFGLVVDTSAPDEPALVSPPDGSLGEPLSVPLEVLVADPNGDPLDVTFLGRRVASSASEFTIIALPDTQHYSETYPDIYTAQTQWIVDNVLARNIVFVTHEGDIVQNFSNTIEWDRADAAMSLLDGVVPYGMGPGNHDQPTTLYNIYFPYTRYEPEAWYGGHEGSKNDNNFQLFSAGGMDFIAVHLEFCPPAQAIAWADSVLESHPGRIAMLTTHGFLNGTGARSVQACTDTQYMWDGLVVPNPNVHFFLCGHVSDEFARTDVVNGHNVYQLLADYQNRPSGGQGWLRILRFVPADDRVYVETYSPWLGQFETDANSQFALDFEMSGFSIVGTSTGVPSGSSVSVLWEGLETDTSYEWHVVVTDSTGKTATGPVWTFTTGGGDVAPPVLSGIAATSVTETSAAIVWTTDEPSDSRVDYGLDPGYGSQAADGGLVVSHSVALAGLAAGTIYHYRVSSQDASGNLASSADFTFETLPPNAPPAASAQSVGTEEDTPVAITLAGSDPEGAPLTFAIASAPAHGALSGAPPDVTYTPEADYSGPDSFTFTVTDGAATSAPAVVSITVAAVNDAPAAGAQSVGTEEGTPVAITLAGSDPDGDPLAFAISAPPASGLLSGSPPAVTYTPDPGYSGPDGFSFTVTDGVETSAPAAVTITVTPRNDPPSADGQSVATLEDTPLAISLTGSDPEGAALVFSVAQPPAAGVLTGAPPALTYTPAADYSGADSFTFTVTDGVETSAPAVVSITVAAVNDAPLAAAQSVGTAEDTAVAIALAGSDVDGDPLTFAVASAPAHGALSGAPPDVTYTPAADYNGADSFSFTVADGAETSAPAVVSVTVAAVNDAPLAAAQSVGTAEDTAVAIALAGSDVDGDPLTFAVASAPAHGALSGAPPAVTYTPAADYNGADSFSFTVADGAETSAPAAVSITVAAVNDAPVAEAQSVATAADTPVAITLTGSDVEGAPLAYSIVSAPANGTLSGAPPALTYTPEPGYSGPDGFTFRVSDGELDSAPAAVGITVAPPAGDFRTQLVKLVIPAGAGSATAAAPASFAAVDPARAIVLISGVTQHAMGWTAQTRQNPNQISAAVELVDGATLRATRSSTSVAQTDTVWALVIEYVGAPGGANELVVRDRRLHTWGSSASSASYGPIGAVASTAKVVVFNAGVVNPNTGAGHYDRGDVRAFIDASKTVQLSRRDGSGAIRSSHQVVEFTGSNWEIQTGDATPSPHSPGGGPESGGTNVTIASVGDVSQAWVYFNWDTNSGNLDERGHRVWLTSPTNLRVQEGSTATATKTVRWYVLRNPDLRVQTGAADAQFTSSLTASISGFTPVASAERSFAWVAGLTSGDGSNHPRDMWQFELAGGSTISLERGYSGDSLGYRYFVVELDPPD
jgi:hypothetical protein